MPEFDFEEAYGPRVAFEGERRKIADVLDKEILVKDFIELPSQFQEGKNFVVISAEYGGKPITIATGSQTLLNQLRRVRENKKFPFKARITKPFGKRYYSFGK